VLQLYEQAHALLQDGTWVVCADEKTSIQAREAEQAPCPSIPKHALHQSPRYHRRGALHLLAGLSVADGLVYGQCSSRKRFIDFRSFLQTDLIPEALRRGVHTLALILDNGPTHAPKYSRSQMRSKLVFQLLNGVRPGEWFGGLIVVSNEVEHRLLQLVETSKMVGLQELALQ